MKIIKVKPKLGAEDNPVPKPISKLLKAILGVALYLFLMDFGLIKYKSFKEKITYKLASLLVVTLFIVSFLILVFSGQNMETFIWYTRYILEIYAYVLVLTLTPENKTFCSYLEHLNAIDLKIGVDSNSFKLDIKILIYCLASIMYKIVSTSIYCIDFNECVRPISIQIIFFIPYASMDVPLIILFFIFYAARCRLIGFRKFIENTDCEPKNFQYLYKSLVDSTETIKKAFDPIFYITFFTDVPCLMLIIYEIIKQITLGSKSFPAYASQIAVALSTGSVIFAPTVAAGSLSIEVNKIKIYFYNMLLEENDPQKEREIQKLINYIEARPFKFHVLGVIPMDASLPMIVINMYITYVIVLLQLTHLY